MIPAWVSSSMPRKMRCLAGPSSLLVARGMPSFAHIARILLRLRRNSSESGGPMVTKSSEVMVHHQNAVFKHNPLQGDGGDNLWSRSQPERKRSVWCRCRGLTGTR